MKNINLILALSLSVLACSEESLPPTTQFDEASPVAEEVKLAVGDAAPTINTEEKLATEGFDLFRDAEIDFAGLERAGTSEDPITIDVDVLGAWIFDEDKSPPFPSFVDKLHGRKVFMKGFMLPDVDFENISEFHLVRSLWGCCFGAPPRVNELIRVSTPNSEGIDYSYNTLEVVGTLEVIFEMEDGIIEDLYRLKADTITVLDEFDDPEAPTGFDPAAAF